MRHTNCKARAVAAGYVCCAVAAGYDCWKACAAAAGYVCWKALQAKPGKMLSMSSFPHI